MKNAHLRFGRLVFTKVVKNSTTQFKVPLDRFIGERGPQGSIIQAHLLSVVGADTQIAALAAAVSNRESFTIEPPTGKSFSVSLGMDAECYRGSLQLKGVKRSVRHLVAVSEELAEIGAGKTLERAILVDDSPEFIWGSLAHIHGVPGTPQWAEWVIEELKRLKAIEPLVGIGCRPLLVKASKGMIMNCVSRGLRDDKITFPEMNGPVRWSPTVLSSILVPRTA